jgi:hypothetical protein
MSDFSRLNYTIGQIRCRIQATDREIDRRVYNLYGLSQVTDIPELHDRLIAGDAWRPGLALITTAPVIQASSFVMTV